MSFKTLVAVLTALTLSSSVGAIEKTERINWLAEAPSKTEEITEELKVEEPEVKWPITKAQMAAIMKRPEASISDELMDDFSRAIELFNLDEINIAYFLGQIGHESGGLKHKVELDSGWRYEYRRDLGNIFQGDGPRYAGGGFLQITGRANYTGFYDYMKSRGIDDPGIISGGKHHIAKHYPWTSGAWWWMAKGMIDYCKNNPDIDRVGARVNGRYLPNGYLERRAYTQRAFKVLGV
jgi:predicted chitinase